MRSARGDAEAISEGLNTLVRILEHPEHAIEEQVQALEALGAMSEAVEAILQGAIWSSEPIGSHVVSDLAGLRSQIPSGSLTDEGLRAAVRILESLRVGGGAP